MSELVIGLILLAIMLAAVGVGCWAMWMECRWRHEFERQRKAVHERIARGARRTDGKIV